LIELLGDPTLPFDAVVLDLGNHLDRATERFCRAAHAIVVVTTCELPAIVNTFEVIKQLSKTSTTTALHLLVNMAFSAREAESVRRRLCRACRRMLGIDLLGSDSSGSNQSDLCAAMLFARFPPGKAAARPLPVQTGCFTKIR
jgi:MinD-like ATPase involved in chromosome partitioning or flagellar assembly